MAPVIKRLLLGASILGIPAAANPAAFTVKGPETVTPLVQRWLQGYLSNSPASKISFKGGDAGFGLAALQNRAAGVALASRRIGRAEESAFISAFGKRPREYKVALDTLVIFVNESNRVTELDLEQLNRIFAGRIRNWNEVGGADGPINLYSREYDSNTLEFFKDSVLQGTAPLLSAQTIPGHTGMLQAVARDRAGIGYNGPGRLVGVKPLKIKKNARSDAIEPSQENFLDGSYPLTRYVYAYVTPARDREDIAAFLDWIRGEEGQDIVRDAGFYPVPPNLREK